MWQSCNAFIRVGKRWEKKNPNEFDYRSFFSHMVFFTWESLEYHSHTSARCCNSDVPPFVGLLYIHNKCKQWLIKWSNRKPVEKWTQLSSRMEEEEEGVWHNVFLLKVISFQKAMSFAGWHLTSFSYWCNPWRGDKQFMNSIEKVF